MFDDCLQATLTLVIGSDTFTLPSGSIDRFELQARPYGFEAEVAFWVSSEGVTDSVFPRFTSNDLIQATLALANGSLVLAGEEPASVSFMGFVTERRLSESTSEDVTGQPMVDRLYTIRFLDPAQTFWRRHRPLDLQVQSSVKDVLELHKAQGIALTYDWPRIEEVKDIVCIGLGGESEASFYDFVIGFIAENGGVLELDAAAGSYRIGSEKSDGGDPTDLDAESTAALRILPPFIKRHACSVQNPFTEAAQKTTDIANDLAVAGVQHGVLAHSAIAKQFDRRVETETERLKQPMHDIEVSFHKCPPVIPAPGAAVKIADGFSTKIYPSGKKYRVIRLDLRALPPADEDNVADYEDTTAVFSMQITAELELLTDPLPQLPPFEPLVYPVVVEGKVLSASGTDTDRTWHMLEGESDSLHRYRVDIPLWNKKIIAPFTPDNLTGHLFFPAYKNQRVLLQLEFDSARIVRFLDWASKLAQDTQGNQIVIGMNGTSGTVVKHVYTDDKPILTIVRTLDGDTRDLQTIEVSDGRIFFEVKEEEASQTASETYNLTPTVEAAQEIAAADTRASIAELTGTFESSMGGAAGSMEAAGAEVEAEAAAAVGTLTAKIEAVEAELSGAVADASEALATVTAKIAEAQAALKQALED